MKTLGNLILLLALTLQIVLNVHMLERLPTYDFDELMSKTDFSA